MACCKWWNQCSRDCWRRFNACFCGSYRVCRQLG